MKKTPPKKLLCFLSIALACFVAIPALAEDAPKPEPEITSWAGPYVGLHAGYLRSTMRQLSATGPDNTHYALLGGGQVGYNWQHDHFVLGLEVDASKYSATSQDPLLYYNQDLMLTSRVRLGYVVGAFLPYIDLGLGYTDSHIKLTSAALSNSAMETGFAGGAGVDYRLTKHWFVRGEYLYVDVPNDNEVLGSTPVSGGSTNQIIRIGINYLF